MSASLLVTGPPHDPPGKRLGGFECARAFVRLRVSTPCVYLYLCKLGAWVHARVITCLHVLCRLVNVSVSYKEWRLVAILWREAKASRGMLMGLASRS